MNEEHKALVISLAKSHTEDIYNKRLARIESISKDWFVYLHQRKHEYVTVSFLQRGYKRHGKVTSNGVEVINGALSAARMLPIVDMIEDIVSYQITKYSERKQLAAKWIDERKAIRPFAQAEEQRIGSLATKRNVQILEFQHPKYNARVSVQTGFVEVSIDCSRFELACPCKYHAETGLNCPHVKALLLHLDGIGLGSSWINRRFHVETYSNSYGCELPSMCLAGQLEPNPNYCPPEFKRGVGRPGKKRKDRSAMRSTEVRRECKACGALGHFAMSCTQSSTEYRFYKHRKKALQWCKATYETTGEDADD